MLVCYKTAQYPAYLGKNKRSTIEKITKCFHSSREKTNEHNEVDFQCQGYILKRGKRCLHQHYRRGCNIDHWCGEVNFPNMPRWNNT